MQVLTKSYPKNCLLAIMDRYSAVVHKMEQVVMFPSLLQDVHGRWAGGPDLYKCFTMLKAICVDVDHGLLPREEWQVKMPGGDSSEAETEAAEMEEADGEVLRQLDIEAQFHLHFSSLHRILTQLTLKAEEVTKIYQEMMEQAM